MPDTSSLPSLYNTAQRLSRLKGYPLLRDTSHYTYRETYAQNVANFARTALDTAHPDVSALKLVDEDIIGQREDLVEFFRLYATIPATWDEPVSVRFDYPGYAASWGSGIGAEVSAGVSIANSGTGGRMVVTKAAHGLSANTWVQLRFSNNIGWRHRVFALIESVTSDTFTTSYQWVFSQTFTSVAYVPLGGYPARKVRTKVVAGFVRREYALPGVTSGVSTAAGFLALDEMRFVNADGDPVTDLNALTDPTATQWRTAALAKEYFVRDSEVRPYLGNILERITTYVPFVL